MEYAEQKTSLRFFGIPRLIPYIRKYRKTLLVMLICGLAGTGVDLALPLLQRYALNHYIAERTLDTLPLYIVLGRLTVGMSLRCSFLMPAVCCAFVP